MTTLTVRPSPAVRWPGLVWKGLVVALGYVVGTMIMGAMAQALGLPMPAIARHLDPQEAMLGIAVAGLVYALVMGALSIHFPFPTWQRFTVLFALSFGLSSFLNGLEAVFFSSYVAPDQFVTLLVIGLSHLVPAALAAVLFRPPAVTTRLGALERTTLAARSPLAWAWRILAAGALFVPVYLFFGSLIAPIVLPYYTEVAGTGLAIPSPTVMLPLEIARGVLFVLIVFPLVAVFRGPRRRLWLWLGLTLAAFIGWASLLGGSFLPMTLRLVHGLEITADSFVHAAIIAWLLGVRQLE